MSDGLFSAVELDSAQSRTGYRLHHIEVYNWGTFDSRVWRLTPGCDTALLTGDIGSGKSTLVDAVTTLLLPANRIAYNKAAGADNRERSLRSYVAGHYKSERIESSGSTKAIGLRDHKSYSVILGVFVNEGFDETVTLAQVFNQRDRSGQPDRFFVTSTKELSVAADFADFGSDLSRLRKRLRDSGADVERDFPKYARQMRRLLGIRSEQAMDLFHQTVSMKSVGNLNEFVRDHMLEPADAGDRIRAIVSHFEDLTKAHAAVRRAKDQLAALEPLVVNCDKHDKALSQRALAERQRDAVRVFFAELKIRLLGEEIERLTQRLAESRREADHTADARQSLTPVRDALIAERAGAGGDRLAALEQIIEGSRAQHRDRLQRRQQFDALVSAAGAESVSDLKTFTAYVSTAQVKLAETSARTRALDEQHAGHIARGAEIERVSVSTRQELESLANRRSNIPSTSMRVRERLCADLGLQESELPFVGELIDVGHEFSVWRGAAERVLRGFALSLLVPQAQYAQVSRWVNDHFLKGVKLVYLRVPERRVPVRPTAHGEGLLLSDTIEVAPGMFSDYLHEELGRRADFACVDTVEDFQRAQRAVTREGQLRSGNRHEKDDRSRVDDPRTWVLGWTNELKVAALTEELMSQQSQSLEASVDVERVGRERDQLGRQRDALAELKAYTTWTDLDWQAAVVRVDEAEAERDRLIGGRSKLAELDRRLKEADAEASRLDALLQDLRGRIAVLDSDLSRTTNSRDTELDHVAAIPKAALAAARTEYDAIAGRVGDSVTTADRCDQSAADINDDLQRTIKRLDGQLNGYALTIQKQMGDIRRQWPEATTELDDNIASIVGYREFRDRVARDDLPRFEAEFKNQLNTNTIRELASFNTWLHRQSEDIGLRVDRINEALGAIDYSPGRYIKLVAERTTNQEVQLFRSELRATTDEALSSGGDQYSEQRFLDVQRIIERFRGRDGHADADKGWTKRVTDVRNWFTFSASELDRESDVAWEHYTDSDGKSGGQKEKLAYTILAASLAYQFGLEWGVERSRDFRFAVIDEAFGRGSDASTRYALDLFAKLGLQLLIVTPLQKVHVIEPYVQAIGFVDNPTGSYSRLQTLTIEEFHAQRSNQSP